ncbi:thioredoxin-disulfide reductase [Eubacteriales bacterium OttesenSCG-928-K08]|nr:thioredoxin-disulfide reductase [Eubacteriales bacterium OttesenSCG-928-K08]
MIDIAIIGGGPAGLSAGLYAARGGATTVLFEEVFVGGQAAKTSQIDNYPGFENGIEGTELGLKMEKQASRFGLSIRYEPVEKLDMSKQKIEIHTAKGVELARTLILCMGASPKKLGIAREEELTGLGISYCATCDGAFFRNRDVAVVGGGDTALSDALYLARFASSVTLIHRRDEFRGSAALQSSVANEPKIKLALDSVVEALLGEDTLSGLSIKNVKTGDMSQIDTSALFIAVGTEPRTGLVGGQIELSPDGQIVTDQLMQTNIPGVYAAGDVRETPLRQVVTAVADGAVAATQALERIALERAQEKEHVG